MNEPKTPQGTDPQSATYWKAQARKWESRAKANKTALQTEQNRNRILFKTINTLLRTRGDSK